MRQIIALFFIFSLLASSFSLFSREIWLIAIGILLMLGFYWLTITLIKIALGRPSRKRKVDHDPQATDV